MDWSLARCGVLAGGLAVTAGGFATGEALAQQAVPPTAKPQPLPVGTVQVTVDDLHCKTCAKKAARKLYAVKGVQKVSWNLKADRLTVVSPAAKPVTPLACWDAVIAGGLTPVAVRHTVEELDAEAIEQLRRAARGATTQLR